MPTQMTSRPYILRGITLRELLEELAEDEGLSESMRERCREALDSMRVNPSGPVFLGAKKAASPKEDG